MVGLVLSLGSGLPIGKEGPFVHIAAVVATLLSKLTASCNEGIYANETRYTEMLSSACAVAIACTFSAPIGGVLYAIEATSVFFKVSNYWRAFFAACCSAITFRFILVFVEDDHVHVTAYYQTNFRSDSFFPEEIPYFTLLGLFLFPLTIAMIVGSLTFPLGFGRIIAGALKQRQWLGDFFNECSWQKTTGALSRGMVCDQKVLEHWTGGPEGGDISIFLSLTCFIITFFILAQVCYTLPVPAGIFLPVFVIGAAMGRLFGETIAYCHPEGIKGVEHTQIYPGIYAIVGAAAFTGSVTHTVSVAVIVFELTGQLTYMLPVLTAVLVANAIGTYLQPSIYDSAIKVKRLPYLPRIPPSRSSAHRVKAEQIMVIDVKFFTIKTTYRELRNILANSPKLRSFPIVTDNGKFDYKEQSNIK
uniref:Uncharacterized protein n=1 Tax=Plectus sambesii TaxID=2011161 RepID=A0A914X3I2_9BILA